MNTVYVGLPRKKNYCVWGCPTPTIQNVLFLLLWKEGISLITQLFTDEYSEKLTCKRREDDFKNKSVYLF